ncbi:uncharacterized protein LOC129757946 [Uranotaenia lowii]|uniref:uncharacterized protein LOC129757946 n=1 Tax=Uranotaenia lowii TaxID=190385 RepID=UPI00247965AC|nr:uncharacterized protein LOC129757946 [Uranotaenia lowii]
MSPKKSAERAAPPTHTSDRAMHSSMEPVVRDGKIREQIELESKVRHDYQKRWGFMTQPETTEYFDLKKNNKKLKDMHQRHAQKVNVHEYDGHGESHFVSKQMFKTLIDTCRCGRKKVTNMHALKCLQKSKSTYEKTDDEDEEQEDDKDVDDGRSSVAGSTVSDKSANYIPQVPVKSSGMYGWPQNRFVEMEKSTYYISPRYTMPGHPIVDSQPYHNIILG